MSDVRLGKVQVILTWKLDRLARSLVHLVQTIQELDPFGVRFVAVTQNIDTSISNPMSRVMLQIFGAFAKLERETGVRNAKRNEKQLDRKRVVFDRNKAIEMHLAGMSIREIAAALGVGAGTVHPTRSKNLPAKLSAGNRFDGAGGYVGRCSTSFSLWGRRGDVVAIIFGLTGRQ
jgi:DNA invertase Pin-like site-specific DNA recombinase